MSRAFKHRLIRPVLGGCIALFLCFLTVISLQAADVIPPTPTRYFNDYAGIVSAATVNSLNAALENLEKTDSSQMLVAIFPKLPANTVLEDYTIRVARAWGVGQKGKNNGAVLFIFVQDHKARIESGRGLEGVIPDALGKRIIDEQLVPNFRSGNYDAGVTAAVNGMIAASKGEYKGTGRTLNSLQRRNNGGWIPLIFFGVFFLIMIASIRRRRGGRRRGWLFGSGGSGWDSGWGSGWGGGGWSDGGGSWGGGGGDSGGGFTGGGGDFGGGGASGSW